MLYILKIKPDVSVYLLQEYFSDFVTYVYDRYILVFSEKQINDLLLEIESLLDAKVVL
ncbi:MAG: hypothetical protein QXN68_00380 [Thermoplasmata archaeon]